MPLWKVYHRTGDVEPFIPDVDTLSPNYTIVFAKCRSAAHLRVGPMPLSASRVAGRPVVDARDDYATTPTAGASFAAKPSELGPLAKVASRIAAIVQQALDAAKPGSPMVRISREQAEELYQLADELDSKLETH